MKVRTGGHYAISDNIDALYDFWCDLSFALGSPALPVIAASAHRPWLTRHSARPPHLIKL